MEPHAIDVTTETTANGESNYVERKRQSEFCPPPTETSSLQERVVSSELVIRGQSAQNAVVSNDSIQSSDSQKNGETINNMESNAIDETTDTSASNEIQPSPTGTKEIEKTSSEFLVGVSNDFIEPTCSEKNGKFNPNLPMNFLFIFF